MSQLLLHHLQAATLSPVLMQDGQHDGLLSQAAIAIDGERIAWIGPEAECPTTYRHWERMDMEGRLVTPGLIDCHTHLIFAGNRAHEFELRLQGADYAGIARAGGGILSTVRATRAASADELLAAALPRLDSLIMDGVTTVEIKSGYGLDTETELKMLRVARRLAQVRPVRIISTYLGAHAIPAPLDADTYIKTVCLPTLQQAQAEGLVDQVDGFCENIAFTPHQIETVFRAAQALGLPCKLHAEQLSHQGGTALATRYQALSVDHLEYATAADAKAMAAAGTVAVLLPGAFYALQEKQLPPIAALRRYQVPMAVATDLNPGSSPLYSMLMAMNMACTLFRLTPAEALNGVTRHAASALGLTDCGQLAPGWRADLAVWNVASPAELAWRMADRPLYWRLFAGQWA